MKLFTPLLTLLTRHHTPRCPSIKLLLHNNAPRSARLSLPLVLGTTAMSSLSSGSTFHPAIEDLTRKLDGLAPRFELGRGDIQVLNTPEEFYTTLCRKILGAKERVFLSSLYIGKEETELVPTSPLPKSNLDRHNRHRPH